MRWIYIPNTEKKYKLYDNGEVFRMPYNRGKNYETLLHTVRKNCRSVIVSVHCKKKIIHIPSLLKIYFGIDFFGAHSWQLSSKEEIAKRNRNNVKKWAKTSKGKQYRRELERRERKELKNRYLSRLINQNSFKWMNSSEINELFETKRKQICLHRKLKQLISQE